MANKTDETELTAEQWEERYRSLDELLACLPNVAEVAINRLVAGVLDKPGRVKTLTGDAKRTIQKEIDRIRDKIPENPRYGK